MLKYLSIVISAELKQNTSACIRKVNKHTCFCAFVYFSFPLFMRKHVVVFNPFFALSPFFYFFLSFRCCEYCRLRSRLEIYEYFFLWISILSRRSVERIRDRQRHWLNVIKPASIYNGSFMVNGYALECFKSGKWRHYALLWKNNYTITLALA